MTGDEKNEWGVQQKEGGGWGEGRKVKVVGRSDRDLMGDRKDGVREWKGQ